MKCPHCGSDAGQEPDEDGLWCINCGKDVNEPAGPMPIGGCPLLTAGIYAAGNQTSWTEPCRGDDCMWWGLCKGLRESI